MLIKGGILEVQEQIKLFAHYQLNETMGDEYNY